MFQRRSSRASQSVRRRLCGEPLENRALLAADLVITEINYHPHDPTAAELDINAAWTASDFEFIEVLNNEIEPLNLAGLTFSSGITFNFPAVTMNPGEHQVIVRNQAAFQARYGTTPVILGQFAGGGLTDGGEELRIDDALGERVTAFTYGNGELWPQLADGRGATLVLKNNDAPNGQLSKWYSWTWSPEYGGSPSSAGLSSRGIVVNEVLAHTDPPQYDSIELYNTTSSAIDISGWYLSDSMTTPNKYRIPNGTTIQAGGYLTFNALQFDPTPLNPGPNDFGLDGAEGDNVVVSISNGSGGTTEFVEVVHFDGSLNGVSYGRWPNATGIMSTMTRLTLNATNSTTRPKIGPLVISEFSYRPEQPLPAAVAQDAAMDRDDLEFVEIHNPTNSRVSLFQWDIGGGIEYTFADNASLAADGAMIIVSFDPADPLRPNRAAAFRAHYGLSASIPLVGPYSGKLDDSGERIVLYSYDTPPTENPSFWPQIPVDEVIYDDDLPWPADADGDGRSLQRISTDKFGSFADSWLALAPTPGVVDIIEVLFGDYTSNNELDKDDIDILNGAIRASSQDPIYDINGDGTVDDDDRNAWIVLAGTYPGDADLDGVVDADDFEEWLKNLGDDVGERWRDGDFTGDEIVDEADYEIWSANRFAVGIRHEPFRPSTRTPRAALSQAPWSGALSESAVGGNDQPLEATIRSLHRQANQYRRSTGPDGSERWFSPPRGTHPSPQSNISENSRDRWLSAKYRSALTATKAPITMAVQPSELTDRVFAELADGSMGS